MSAALRRPPVISIDLLGPDDASALARLHAAIFPRGWVAEEFRRLLTGTGAVGLAARAPGAEEAAGFALGRAVAGEVEIITLGVLPEVRRLGFGAALLAALADRAARRGCGRMVLEVAEDNAAARALYRRHGFGEIGRRARYYRRPGGEAVDAIVLSRRLGGIVDAGPAPA